VAPIALINAGIYIGGHDFTAEQNQIMLNAELEEKDKTTFGSGGWRERQGGLRDVKASGAGFWQSAPSDAVDPEAFNNLGVTDRVYTVTATRVEAQTAYMSQFLQSAYSTFDEVGELMPWTLGLSGSNRQGLVRGQLAKAKGTVSATGAIGSPVQLGAVGSTQFVYATLHVLPPAGTTISVKIESDNASNFASPANVGSSPNFGPITTSGGTWAVRVPGPITDDWFRLNVTAITGTFTVVGAIGVGS
jgi:hypothetical protein